MEEKNNWLGARGFDEANYYKSDKQTIGIDTPDDQIKSLAIETISRNTTNKENVEVQVASGEMKLIGTVKTREERAEIEKLVREIAGVKSVENAITLSSNH